LALSGNRVNKTLFQETVARLNHVNAESVLPDETIIVSNAGHPFLVLA
jgi:hypothetical protein